jgi:hypothetical protein
MTVAKSVSCRECLGHRLWKDDVMRMGMEKLPDATE